ncbi:hypothetical protein MANES_05G135252v8, partial [Manihot esculenta]
LNIPVIVKKHKIKWWGSFRNSTTEEVVNNWIIKRAQFPTVSYASKLTLQGEPSFGAQKAQCQALLVAAKTLEKCKMICQQMFNHLASGESVKKGRDKANFHSCSNSIKLLSTSSLSNSLILLCSFPSSSASSDEEDDSERLKLTQKEKKESKKKEKKGQLACWCVTEDIGRLSNIPSITYATYREDEPKHVIQTIVKSRFSISDIPDRHLKIKGVDYSSSVPQAVYNPVENYLNQKVEIAPSSPSSPSASAITENINNINRELNIHIHSKDRYKTAFTVPFGQYEWN